jgi:DNA-binding GntR family transcriptional regulator
VAGEVCDQLSILPKQSSKRVNKFSEKSTTFVAQDSHPTVAFQVARDIAKRIIQGHYKPGFSLREIPLADEFGVSRTSLREALRMLERDGVVRIEPRRGASVTQLSTDELVEVYQVRAALLGLAMAMFCAACEDGDVEWLHERLKHMSGIAQDDKSRAATEHAEISADMARYIYSRSGNGLLIEMLSKMSLQIARYTLVGLSAPQRRSQSNATWVQVVQAIKDRDAQAAERYGRQLVRDNLRFALARLSGD